MGAETECRDDVNWTPLDHAARNGFYKTMKLLLDNDVDVDAVDKYRMTPLHHAASMGHVECVILALDYHAQISARNYEGRNCLDLAVENNQREVCMALIQHSRYNIMISYLGTDGNSFNDR